MAGIGPAPKPASKRRRRTKPATYGAAEPITAPAVQDHDPELGIDDPHPMVVRMWDALQTSAEARFYSAADWERVRLELWHANVLLTSGKPIVGNSWAAVQHGLNAMLISPAEKRRCAIELKPTDSDPDEDAAVSMTAKYQQKLAVVKSDH
jgi:hypothetical protein